MKQNASSTTTRRNRKRAQAPAISIRYTRHIKKESSEHHGKVSNDKTNKELPLYYTEPIFKAKKHDPL